MRKLLVLALSLVALLFPATVQAGHLPAYPLPAAACNQGTETAYENANPSAYGRIPVTEGTPIGCHHHHLP